MEEQLFYRHTRLTPAQFEYFTHRLLQQGLSDGKVPATKKGLLFLWYLANQNSFREMSDKFDLSQGAAHNAMIEVLDCLCSLSSEFLRWPNDCEKRASAFSFQRTCGMHNIIGSIDGCHIQIRRPVIRGGDYINRKGFYSVLLQGIVNERGEFMDIFAGPPGKVHDARMLRSSSFFVDWRAKMGEYKLLGDTAYIGHNFPFIVTPKRDNGMLSQEDLAQNAKVSRGGAGVWQTEM